MATHGADGRSIAAEGAPPRLKLFISYSRQDMAFADELVAGLDYDGGYEVFIDRQAIHESEDWKARLGSLIAGADTIVFVLSPASAASPICAWEVEEAERVSKRIVPVLAAPLEGAQPPSALARLNYVRFDPEDDGRPRSLFGGLAALRRALNTDIEWLREHTRLLTRAQEWDRAERVANRLLVGEDIAAAKAWLDGRPADAPAPLELHRDYITASEEAEAARLSAERQRARRLRRAVRRTRAALVGALALALVAGGLGLWAFALFDEAEAERATARSEQERAESALAEMMIERSWDIRLATGDFDRELVALKYALAGYRLGPQHAELARAALARVSLPEDDTLVRLTFDDAFRLQADRSPLAVADPTARRVAFVSSDGRIALWSPEDGETTRLLPETVNRGRGFGFHSSGDILHILGDAGEMRRWDIGAGRDLAPVEGFEGDVITLLGAGDKVVIATRVGDDVALWDAADGASISRLKGAGRDVVYVSISPDYAKVLTPSTDRVDVWDVATGERIYSWRGFDDASIYLGYFGPDSLRVAFRATELLDTAGSNASQPALAPPARSRLELIELPREGRDAAGVFSVDHAELITVVYFSADGDRIYMTDALGDVYRWDAEASALTGYFDGRRVGFQRSVFAPAREWYIGDTGAERALIWEAGAGRIVGEAIFPGADVRLITDVPERNIAILAAFYPREPVQIYAWRYDAALRDLPDVIQEACGRLEAAGQLQFSEQEIVADSLIADTWARDGANPPLCPVDG